MSVEASSSGEPSGGPTNAAQTRASGVAIDTGDPAAQGCPPHARAEVKRLPVVDEEGNVIGIVGRADLLKVFLRPDQEIFEEVTQRVLPRTLSLEPGTIKVTVRDGVVPLEGVVEQRSMIPLVIGLVHSAAGVVGVDTSLGYEVDDVSVRPTLPLTWG